MARRRRSSPGHRDGDPGDGLQVRSSRRGASGSRRRRLRPRMARRCSTPTELRSRWTPPDRSSRSLPAQGIGACCSEALQRSARVARRRRSSSTSRGACVYHSSSAITRSHGTWLSRAGAWCLWHRARGGGCGVPREPDRHHERAADQRSDDVPPRAPAGRIGPRPRPVRAGFWARLDFESQLPLVQAPVIDSLRLLHGIQFDAARSTPLSSMPPSRWRLSARSRPAEAHSTSAAPRRSRSLRPSFMCCWTSTRGESARPASPPTTPVTARGRSATSA